MARPTNSGKVLIAFVTETFIRLVMYFKALVLNVSWVAAFVEIIPAPLALFEIAAIVLLLMWIPTTEAVAPLAVFVRSRDDAITKLPPV